MTHPNEPMPDNPGDPDVTDEQNISPNEAEALADEAAEAADSEEEPLGADIEAELTDADIDAELEHMLDDERARAAGDAEVDDTVLRATHDAAVAELTEDLQRITAEYSNYRRRTERERGVELVRARASVVSELLPMLDELDMAAQHGDLEQGPLKSFADKLRGTLTKLGLERFAEVGDEFNPERHEAIQDASTGDEKVLGTVVRPGYTFNDQLIRTAMVIIADPDTEPDTA